MLVALGVLLNQYLNESGFYHSCSYGYSKGKDARSLLGSVVGWGKVDTLVLIDLRYSRFSLSRSLLLKRLGEVVEDPFILKFISSFLSLPILGKTGDDLGGFGKGVVVVGAGA